jgi:hypothetical protein
LSMGTLSVCKRSNSDCQWALNLWKRSSPNCQWALVCKRSSPD